MHPAFSVIFFTSFTGAGYGLAMVLGVGLLDAAAPAGRISYIVAGVMIAAGLCASTLHLLHPERALLAFTQWRSSWLSREGVAALATFIPLTIAGAGSVFFGADWRWAAVATAVLSLVTVWCTAMIYASLKTVHQWASPWTQAVYLTFSLSGGLVLASAVLSATGERPTLAAPAVAALAVAWGVKRCWWRRADRTESSSTAGSATGLGHLGDVRLLERPHGGENYLTREMGYRVARRHAAKLRRVSVLLGFAIPAVALAGEFYGIRGLAVAGAVSHIAGVLAERWLFFAEARHTVMLYYGDRSA